MALRLTQSLIRKIQEYDDIRQYDMTFGKIITTGCSQDDIVSIITTIIIIINNDNMYIYIYWGI